MLFMTIYDEISWDIWIQTKSGYTMWSFYDDELVCSLKEIEDISEFLIDSEFKIPNFKPKSQYTNEEVRQMIPVEMWL